MQLTQSLQGICILFENIAYLSFALFLFYCLRFFKECVNGILQKNEEKLVKALQKFDSVQSKTENLIITASIRRSYMDGISCAECFIFKLHTLQSILFIHEITNEVDIISLMFSPRHSCCWLLKVKGQRCFRIVLLTHE